MKKILLRKNLIFAVMFAMIAVLAACGTKSQPVDQGQEEQTENEPAETETEDKIVIAGTLQDMSNEFMVMLKDAMDETVSEYPNVELQILDGEGSPEKQVSQIENFIAQGVDAIILCPQDGTALVPAVKDAIDAGIPVNHKDAGIMQAEYVVEQLGGKGNIAYLRGPIGHFAEVQRYEGTKEVFDQYPDIKIVYDQTGNWDRDQGMTLMENWLQAGEKIDCVMSQNDEMVLGAITALEGADMNTSILTCGMDAIPDALLAIEEGRLDATIFQDAFGQGSGALRVAYDAATGKEVEEQVIPWALVTKDNVADYK